jgi:hypothetical protein
MAFAGIAALAIGGTMLLANASAMFVPVIGMVGGIAAMVLTNHERLKLRIEASEKRLAEAKWRSGSAYGTDLPLTATVRSSRLGLRSCGNAAIA